MNKRFVSLFLIIAAVAGGLIYQGTQSAASLVLEPSVLVQKGADASLERIRVGGKVTNDEIGYQLQPEIVLTFRVEDVKNPSGSIPVVYRGLKPDMFAAGRDVIIDGDFEGGVLKASKLLTQCPSKYEPPVPGSTEQNAHPPGVTQ